MVNVPRHDLLLRDNKVLLQTGWWQDQEDEAVDILDIVERLQNGDLTALNDLDKLKITYTEMDKNGAKIIVFKYDGIQYTIKCYAAEGGNEGPTADFSTYSDLQKYVNSQEMKNILKNMGVTDFNYGFTYDSIANTVASKHQSDFASVTKDQLAQEFKAEYDKKVKEYQDAQANQTDFQSYYALTQYTSSTTFRDAVLKKLGLTLAQFEKNTGLSFEELVIRINSQYGSYFKMITKEDLILYATSAYKTLTLDLSQFTPQRFATYDELKTYLISNEMQQTLRSMGVAEFDYDFTYGDIANTIAAKHQSDFASVTKDQLAQEFKAEYDRKVKAYNNSRTPSSEFNSYTALNQYLQGADFKSAVLKQLGIKEADVEKNCGVSFDLIVYVLSNNHSKDFASVTKNQLIQEAIKEYNLFVETKKAADASGGSGETADGNISTAYDKIKKTVSSAANWLPSILEETAAKINVKFSTDAYGKMYFTDKNTTAIYNSLVQKLIAEISNDERDAFLQQIGGKDVFTQIINAAWITSYNNYSSTETWSTKSFISSVLTNLQNILTRLQTSPEYLEYFTNDCYRDTTLTNSLTNINLAEVKCGYNKDNNGYPKVYQSDGKVHLDDDNSDKRYQETMKALLERIYNKYPMVDKKTLETLFLQAQKDALYSITQSGKDIPTTCIFNKGKGTMSALVSLILYKFDKLFKDKCLRSVLPGRTVEKLPTPENRGSSYTSSQLEDIKAGAKEIAIWAQDVGDDIVANCKSAIGENNNPEICTLFGFDSSGNIVFADNNTKVVYDTIFAKLKAKISRFAPNGLAQLGGDAVLKKLLQAAWITTYNTFNSSQGNSLANFVNKVMENLDKMLGKLQTNPELLEVFIKRGSYADTTLTSGLRHYNTNTTAGGDETIVYRGTVTTYQDGTVHLSNTTDDDDYQVTMNALLERIKAKYTSVPTETLTAVFRNAQRMALATLQGNISDCPYGTANNNNRVDDRQKDWDLHDYFYKLNRSGDKHKIHMDQLVQITLYYFDKLLYKQLLA